jgi:putative membrane-bound dehydrogenase-like protein
MKRLLAMFWITGAICPAAQANDFPAIYNTEPPELGQPMDPSQAASGMKLPPGYSADVFASEPAVQNPIAVTWDRRGRMWVAENYTYAERARRFDLALRDRVVILHDADGDGRAESRKVFIDDVQMLTGIEVGRGGVWLMCPPQVLFIPDADGDDTPDGPPQVVLDGFTVARENYHNFANGLRFGPDGWLYGRCGHSCPGRVGIPGTPDERRIPIEGGVWRFHPVRKTFEVLVHGTTNPWGHDWDRHGEGFVINTVNGHLWHLIPGAHFKESFGADPNEGVYERLDMHADHWHFDTTGSWTDSRDGKANNLGGGHAHIGMMIYQADHWPASMRGRLLTLNMHGRRANVERLEPRGAGYVGRHEPDFLIASDPFFRGMELTTGPDGAVYVVDWSDAGECHEANGVHRTSGRIYKITHGTPSSPAAALADLQRLDPDAVRRLMRHPNAWYERQARLALAAAPLAPGVVEALNDLLQHETDPAIRLRALWALHAGGRCGPDHLAVLLNDSNEHLRVWAIRLLTDAQPLDTILGPMTGSPPAPMDPSLLATFTRMARHDGSGLVRLALASTLQRLPVADRPALAAALAWRDQDAADHNLPSMVWYGLIPVGDSDPTALAGVAESCRWPDTLRWITRNLAGRLDKNPAPLDALLTRLVSADPALRRAVLHGVAEALRGWRKAPRPASWESFAASLSSDSDPAIQSTLRELAAVFGDGRALDQVRQVALDAKADLAVRQASLKTLIEQQPPDLRDICLKLLDTRVLNVVAARGLALFDDPQVGKALAASYRRFQAGDRPALIGTLVSRPAFAAALLDQVAAGKIPPADLSAFHARQILALNDPRLASQLKQAWGELRDTPDDKRQLTDKLRAQLTPAVLASADLSKGRAEFHRLCAACHMLYGQGGRIGPDLTGSGRADLGYLLDNLVDPSAVVGADYRFVILTLQDGRVLTGVVAAQTGKTLTLRTLTEEVTVEKTQVARQDVSPLSMMPEGLLSTLTPDQARDLIAYLMWPRQVALPPASK